jgi:hypothetical protein
MKRSFSKAARKPRLMRRLSLLATAGVLGCAVGYDIMTADPFKGQPEELTANEQTYVRSFFGTIDTIPVRKHQEEASHKYLGMAFGNNIGLYGPAMHARDYTLADAFAKTVFMHEMTHVWQYQTYGLAGMLKKKWDCRGMEDPYAYTLTPRDHFGQFCPEQQAAMVEDYVGRYLSDWGASSYRIFHDMDKRGRDPQLSRVVEEAFPDAAAMRRAYEGKTYEGKGPRPSS